MVSSWNTILEADDDAVNFDMLQQLGLADLWEQHNLGEEYDFMRDFV